MSEQFEIVLNNTNGFEVRFKSQDAIDQRQKQIQAFLQTSNPYSVVHQALPWNRFKELASSLDKADWNHERNALNRIARGLDLSDKGNRRALLKTCWEKLAEFPQTGRIKDQILAIIPRLDPKLQSAAARLIPELYRWVGSRSARLKQLAEDWQSQGTLSHCNISDLFQLEQELTQYQKIIDKIDAGFTPDLKDHLGQRIAANLQQNKISLKEWQDRLECAYGWRIHATAVTGDLQCDDAFESLLKDLQDSIFRFDSPEALIPVQELLEHAPVRSTDLNFNKFVALRDRINQSQNPQVKSKGLNTNGSKPPAEQLIPVVIKNGWLVPRDVAVYIPEQIRSVGDFIRYYYFHIHHEFQGFVGWIQEWFVGTYADTATLINETDRLLKNLDQTILQAQSQQQSLDLAALGEGYAMRCAAELPDRITDEQHRSSRLKFNALMGFFLGQVPSFSDQWTSQLLEAKTNIEQRCHAIVGYLLQDFESMLITRLQSKTLELPKTLIRDLYQFIRVYGDELQCDQFLNLIDPLNIIPKMPWLMPAQNSTEPAQRINPATVGALRAYLQAYGTPKEIKAVNALIGCITRKQLPQNTAEEIEILYPKVQCLFKSTEPVSAFNQYLDLIADQLIAPTGDDDHDVTLAFLKRHAPLKAMQWESARHERFKQMVEHLRGVFTAAVELDLQSQNLPLHGYDQVILKLTKMPQYQAQIVQYAMDYVARYTGTQCQYFKLIAPLGHPEILRDYCHKRLQWLIAISYHQPMEYTEDDFAFFKFVGENKAIADGFCALIYAQYQGEHSHLHPMIVGMNNPEVTSVYFENHARKLLSDRHYETLIETLRAYSKLLKDNVLFNDKLQGLLSDHLQQLTASVEHPSLGSESLEEIIINYGSATTRDQYRLARINSLFQRNDLDGSLFYRAAPLETPAGNQQLMQLYQTQLNQSTNWDPHLQYYVEAELPSFDFTVRNTCRMRWLEAFLFQPETFENNKIIKHSILWQQQYFSNLEKPTDQTSLSAFYGPQNIALIIRWLDKRLDQCDERLSDDVLRLIQHYCDDPAIKDHPQSRQLTQKLAVYQRGKMLYYQLHHSQYQDAMTLFEQSCDSVSRLQDTSADAERQQMMEYEYRWFDVMKSTLIQALKNSIGDPTLMHQVSQSKLSKELIDEIQELGRQAVNDPTVDANPPAADSVESDDLSQMFDQLLPEVMFRIKAPMQHLAQQLALTRPMNEGLTAKQQQDLMRDLILIRTSGKKSYIEKLDTSLNALVKQQFKLLMHPEKLEKIEKNESLLMVVNQLALYAGSDELKSQTQTMVRLFNQFQAKRTKPAVDSHQLSTYEKVIDHYINRFDSHIYQYFIDKHQFDASFAEQMKEKLLTERAYDNSEEGLLDQPLDIQALAQRMVPGVMLAFLTKADQHKAKGLFYQPPTENDAQKLFVAFCVQIQAHQLKTFWKNAINTSGGIAHFQLEDISRHLVMLTEQLKTQFPVEHHGFNEKIVQAIRQDQPFFVSWSNTDMNSQPAIRAVPSLRGV